ncbi:hypothetical protein PL373_03735 [Tenacibaculum maritimum]|nr:hypothetical protein [Tenacibaculum maritimum]MDB0600265.1 hypothetical protein [Tenacibaculum maritimum]MDB0610775.1 hypothetical protein [Tenacibaculum maritimum]
MNKKIEKDNEPFERLVSQVKQKVYSLEKKNGKKPTFEEYVESLIDEGTISTNRLREELRVLALAWKGARFGNTNWKKLFNELQNESLYANKNFTKKDTQMKKNKILIFIEGLGLELDEEIIKGIRSIGIVKLLVGISGFLLLRFLVSYFGSDDDVFTFYFYSAIGLILFLSWYISKLKDDSKMFSVFRSGILTLCTVVSVILILAIFYGVIQNIIEAFKYIY